MHMTRKRLGTIALFASLACTAFGAAPVMAAQHMSSDQHMSGQHPVMVGGAAMYPAKTIVQNASQAKNLTTLVAAVKAAGLVQTLSSKGPFTVFAPTNSAFDALPAGTVKTLLKPANKAKLTSILTYHVIAGDYDAADLMKKISAGGGKATLKTVEGEPLMFSTSHGKVMVTDAKGDTAVVTKADVTQSNGVVHVINKVLMP